LNRSATKTRSAAAAIAAAENVKGLRVAKDKQGNPARTLQNAAAAIAATENVHVLAKYKQGPAPQTSAPARAIAATTVV
jgi:hypothetical protein